MFKTLKGPGVMGITLAAAGILMVTMGARQSLGLFVGPLNTSTGLGIVAISFALSFACTYLPGISALSDGTRTIILTVAISCAGALLFPVKTQSEEAEQ